MPARRALLLSVAGAALSLILPLSGCGWAPLYADPETGPADAELRAIRVDPIPERVGQKLELALRSSLNSAGVPTPSRYLLRTTLRLVRGDLGIQTSGLGTRGQLDVYASYGLTEIAKGTPLTSGTSHVAESFEITPNEYSALVAEDDARSRAVEELRRDLITRLTVFFQRRIAEGAGRPVPR